MQPVDGYQWQRVSGTAAGTVVLKASPTTLHSIVWGNTQTGTVTVYDHASGPTNQVVALNNNTGTIPSYLLFDAKMKNGLTVVVGGTTDMTFTYQ